MEIFIIKNLYKNNIKDGWQVDNVAFKEMEEAIKYVENKLTKEEITINKKAKDRGLKSWYEYDSKNYLYEIKVVDLK